MSVDDGRNVGVVIEGVDESDTGVVDYYDGLTSCQYTVSMKYSPTTYVLALGGDVKDDTVTQVVMKALRQCQL